MRSISFRQNSKTSNATVLRKNVFQTIKNSHLIHSKCITPPNYYSVNNFKCNNYTPSTEPKRQFNTDYLISNSICVRLYSNVFDCIFLKLIKPNDKGCNMKYVYTYIFHNNTVDGGLNVDIRNNFYFRFIFGR